MALDTYALTSVERARLFMRGSTENLVIPGLQIYHNGTGVQSATVAVTAVALVITTDLAEHVLTLADVANNTLTKIAAVINAVTNWVATVVGTAAAPSVDLEEAPTTEVLGMEKELELNLSADFLITELINGVSAAVEDHLQYQVLTRSHTEYFSGGDTEYVLEAFPVTAVSRCLRGRLDVVTIQFSDSGVSSFATIQVLAESVLLKSVASGVETATTLVLSSYATLTLLVAAINAVQGWTATINSGYANHAAAHVVPMMSRDVLAVQSTSLGIWEQSARPTRIDLSSGIIYFAKPLGRATVQYALKVIYTAGFATIPKGLELAVCSLIGDTWDDMQRDTTLDAERLADYAWRASKTSLSEKYNKVLGPWLSPRFS